MATRRGGDSDFCSKAHEEPLCWGATEPGNDTVRGSPFVIKYLRGSSLLLHYDYITITSGVAPLYLHHTYLRGSPYTITTSAVV